MVRMYMTPQELSEAPIGLGLASQINALAPGVIDKLLSRASARCDTFCEKRLQAPGTSTLANSASAGDATISVASTLTLDNGAEQALILDIGTGTQETVQIVPGGVTVTSWTSPYPGTVLLSSPLQYGHSNGASVTYIYREVMQAGTSSTSDPYSEALQSQAAQLALAHLPSVHIGLTRMVFLKTYPLITVYTVEHAYSFDTTYNLVFNSADPTFIGGIILEPLAGFYRFRVGTVVLPEGMIRTSYTAGYVAIPDDIKIATSLYFGDMMRQLVNPYEATDITQGKRRVAFALSSRGKTPAVQEAENILCNYRRRV